MQHFYRDEFAKFIVRPRMIDSLVYKVSHNVRERTGLVTHTMLYWRITGVGKAQKITHNYLWALRGKTFGPGIII